MPRRKPDPEDGTGIEFPSIAPTEGVKMTTRQGSKVDRHGTKGVQIVGGAPKPDMTKGVQIVDTTHPPVSGG